MKRTEKGQGMLEYIIIFAVVLAAIIAFANGGFRASVDKVFTGTQKAMHSASANIAIK